MHQSKSSTPTQHYVMYVILIIALHYVTSVSANLEDQQRPMNCGADKIINVAWANLPPYIFIKNESEGVFLQGDEPEGALHSVLINMTYHCCGNEYSLSYLSPSGSARELEQDHASAPIVLPITREPAMLYLDQLARGQAFLPVLETPGSFVLTDVARESNTILVSLGGSWPLGLVIIASAGVAGILIWLLDRTHNQVEFPKGFIDGAGEGTWWAFVTMTTVGYGDKSPKSIPARTFGLVWMFAGIVLMSVFTATLVMAFDADGNAGDIKGSKVGVLWGSFEEHQAFYEGASAISFRNISSLMQGLKGGDVDVALVELNYALYALGELEEEGIDADHIIQQESVHGILTHGISDDVLQCFAREISRTKFHTMDFIMRRTGRLARKSSSDKVSEKANKLMSSHILAAYILFAVWLALVIGCMLWEFLWFRKQPQPESKERENGSTTHEMRTVTNAHTVP